MNSDLLGDMRNDICSFYFEDHWSGLYWNTGSLSQFLNNHISAICVSCFLFKFLCVWCTWLWLNSLMETKMFHFYASPFCIAVHARYGWWSLHRAGCSFFCGIDTRTRSGVYTCLLIYRAWRTCRRDSASDSFTTLALYKYIYLLTYPKSSSMRHIR